MDQKQLEIVCNEWMRRYIADPKAFEIEFQTVIEFKESDDTGKVPGYGANVATYLFNLAKEIGA